MANLGNLLFEVDFEEARPWWEQAAEAGEKTAMANLAIVLAEEDPIAARSWYERVVLTGDTLLVEFIDEETDSLRDRPT
jgi:TPR repeat protein